MNITIFIGVTKELLIRAASNKAKGKVTKNEYSPQIKAFAFNMFFYSTNAYEYLRSTFDFALPHKKTILSWLSSSNADPGFLSESFAAIKHFVETSKCDLIDGYLPCSMIFDEVSIKKHLDFAPCGSCNVFLIIKNV